MLAIDDIQGNIIAGFNKDHQILLLLAIDDVDAAKHWLGSIHSRIATTAEVLAYNRLRKSIKSRRGLGPSGLSAIWANIAFSYAGLTKLTSAGETAGFGEAAFENDLWRRSALIGDPDDPQHAGHVSRWQFGGRAETSADVLLILAGDDAEQLRRFSDDWRAGLRDHTAADGRPGLREITDPVVGDTLGEELNGHEHFGFKDGVSQPGPRGRASLAAGDFITPRLLAPGTSDANRFGKPGQPLVWPGQFVVGLPRQDDLDREGSLRALDVTPAWAANGSFLVFRKLRQDVAGFWRSMGALSEGSADPDPADRLASRLVGRWRSGTPIMRSPEQDEAAIAADSRLSNDFRFRQATPPLRLGQDDGPPPIPRPSAKADPDGVLCPLAAHIRKVNPRDDPTEQSGPADTLTRLVLRRGIPYGPPLPDFRRATDDGVDRGLLFLCYQASIERQFEFLMSQWVNQTDKPRVDGGRDAVLGRHAPDSTLPPSGIDVTESDGQRRAVPLLQDWITPVGGGYFFSPSISAIRDRLSVADPPRPD